MKKFLIIFSLLVSSLAFGQEDIPVSLFGVYANGDGEVLQINRDLDQIVFQRRSKYKIEAVGTIKLVNGELHIIRADKKDEYSLAFFIGNENIVITKPRSKSAWLWTRIQ